MLAAKLDRRGPQRGTDQFVNVVTSRQFAGWMEPRAGVEQGVSRCLPSEHGERKLANCLDAHVDRTPYRLFLGSIS